MARSAASADRWALGLALAAVLALGLALLAGLLELGGGYGTRQGWWLYGYGLRMLRNGAVLAAAASGLGLLAALGLWAARRAGAGRSPLALVCALAALAVGGVALGLPLATLQRARGAPPIHDITTDTERPPAFQALLARRAHAANPPDYDGPQTAALQRRGYPDIAPALFREAPPAVLVAAERVARELGWEIVAAVPAEGRLEASDRTPLFGFTDDIVVRVEPAAGGGSRLDIRSKSRVGRSDVGTNARRVRRFLQALRATGLTPGG